MSHRIGRGSFGLIVARLHQPLVGSHPANSDSRTDVIRHGGDLPGTEAAHRQSHRSDALAIDFWARGEKLGAAKILMGDQPGQAHPEVHQVRRQRLLAFESRPTTIGPVERVVRQTNISLRRQVVSQKTSAVVPVDPFTCQSHLVWRIVPGLDDFFLTDAKLRTMIVQQQQRRVRSGAIRYKQVGQYEAVAGQVGDNFVRCITVALPAANDLRVKWRGRRRGQEVAERFLPHAQEPA